MYMWLKFPVVSLSVLNKPARKWLRYLISSLTPFQKYPVMPYLGCSICNHYSQPTQFKCTSQSFLTSWMKKKKKKDYSRKKKKLVIYWGGEETGAWQNCSQESWAEGLSLRETEPRKTRTQTAVHKAQAPTTSNPRGWGSARRWFPAKKNSQCRFPVLTAKQTDYKALMRNESSFHFYANYRIGFLL